MISSRESTRSTSSDDHPPFPFAVPFVFELVDGPAVGWDVLASAASARASLTGERAILAYVGIGSRVRGLKLDKRVGKGSRGSRSGSASSLSRGEGIAEFAFSRVRG